MRIIVEPLAPPAEEPITPAQLEALARIVPGDEEPTLWPGFISAARQQVEHDTDQILIATPCLVTVVYDEEPVSWPVTPAPHRWRGLTMPSHVLAVTAATVRTVTGATGVFDPTRYRQVGGGVVQINPLAATDRIEFEMTLGWDDAATLASMQPALVQAVGLLAAHYVTAGRDLVATGAALPMPMGYTEAIQASRQESLA